MYKEETILKDEVYLKILEIETFIIQIEKMIANSFHEKFYKHSSLKKQYLMRAEKIRKQELSLRLLNKIEDKYEIKINNLKKELKNLERYNYNSFYTTSKKNRKTEFRILILIEISLIIFMLFLMNLESNKTKDKQNLQSIIVTSIKNGAHRDTMKNIILTYPSLTLKQHIFHNKNSVYKNSISLEQVLKDINSKNYTSEKFNNDLNLKIVKLLEEEKQSSPIDKLDKNQAHLFQNIKLKLDTESYSKIELDLLKIIEDLSVKNSLIHKYLNQSDISFYISWVALFISVLGLPIVLIQVVQYFQQFRTGKKDSKIQNK